MLVGVGIVRWPVCLAAGVVVCLVGVAPLVEALAENGAGPSAPAQTRERFRLERLIAALPDTARAVITLFYLQDRSVDEVAEALELPTGTVKTHLHRSRAALRRAWLRETAREEDDELRRL